MYAPVQCVFPDTYPFENPSHGASWYYDSMFIYAEGYNIVWHVVCNSPSR